jgi:hypothetical protein
MDTSDRPLPAIAEALSTFQPGRYRLGEILVAQGLCPEEAIAVALSEQASRGGRLGEILVRQRVCTRDQVSEALAYQALAGAECWRHMGRSVWHPGRIEGRQGSAGHEFWVIGVPEVGRYLRASDLDRAIADLFTHHDAFPDLLRAVWARCGVLVTPNQVVQLFHRFSTAGLLVAPASEAQRSRFHWRRLLQTRIPLADPTPGLERLGPILRASVTLPFLLGAWGPLVLVATGLAWQGRAEIGTDVRWLTAHASLGVLGLYYASVALSVAVHEFGHAALCHVLGGPVRQVGVMLYLGFPMGYCDVGGAYLLPRKRDRIAVSLGGLYYQVALGAIAALVWAWAPLPPLARGGMVMLMLLTAASVVFNLNPFARLDGYYVFADLIGIPNLRSRSFAFLRAWVRGERSESLSRAQAWLFLAYGTLGLVTSWALVVLAIRSWSTFFHRLVAYGLK